MDESDRPDQDRPDQYGEVWADIYDEEFGGIVLGDGALDVLAELADGGRVLELGIGTGRVALPLASRGVAVEGIDASPSMVARLRAKPGGDAIPIAIGDMAELAIDGPFSLVYVVFNTIFGLLTQKAQVACFRRVGELLEPGGSFLLECFVPDLGRFDRGQTFRTIGVDAETVRVEASRHFADTQQIATAVIWYRNGDTSVRPLRIRYAWPSELDLMAELAGLSLRERWSSWDRAPFDAASTRHISVYSRPAGEGSVAGYGGVR